ncbi:FAD-binding oxidoreductase [Ornithinimicrobium avium]|uniref:FAD-binding oxidoreductase n=1 Tax=Ornithinimicrobium avium TaxID=2283195 RepID=UPI00192E0344|nr:FAD-binding protein [Ornithinimicrobium avium]
MSTRTDLLDRLSPACRVRAATGEDHVDGVGPQVVASPASTEETSALMRACHEHGLAVVVRGHGSKLAWGRPPSTSTSCWTPRGWPRSSNTPAGT